MKEIIFSWLEEGFARFKGAPEGKTKYENSLIPSVTNDAGEIITPRPLFPIFFGHVELDPNFLVQYLEVIENALILGKGKPAQLQIDGTKQGAGDKKDISTSNGKKYLIPIEYCRKNIFLSRTMFPLYELPDYIVPKTSPHYERVLTRNSLYRKAVEYRKASPEVYYSQGIQVGYVESSDKQQETIPIIHEDKGAVVNSYEMKEHYHRKEVVEAAPPKTIQEYVRSRTKFRNSEEFIENIGEYPSILERLKNSLYVMEKTLNYNTYKNTILSYNNCDIDSEKAITMKIDRTPGQPSISLGSQRSVNLKKHLIFHMHSMRHEYRVTCTTCNLKNPSIFVTGYGVLPFHEMDREPRGMVLCWNVHKCEHPERIYHTEEVVTCVDFSKSKPFLVAAGMRYGLITVFDLRRSAKEGHIDNALSNMRPTGAITSIRWIKKKYSLAGEGEILVATSMDGLITTWNYGRTLEGNILRTVKRGETCEKEQGKLILSIDAAATCFQAQPEDQDIFMIGTIEGQILQFDFIDPEDYVHVYNCHNGPLYDLVWSPIVENVFVSCGADRTVHIWEVGRLKPCKTVHIQDAVLKVALSNVRSTLFAIMTKKILFIYDFYINLHKPLIELASIEKSYFTSVVFCPRNNWILVGHSNGVINMYEIADLAEIEGDQKDALREAFLPE